ncbi:uncharacterized protein LOC134705527 [Mytilus trossulus]|uniref:uncharacterized protein LOC134705527 n=1 Tax=Mytilus trossulus TaxID=6551 RepID=UPI003005DE03
MQTKIFFATFLSVQTVIAFLDPCTVYPKGFIPKNETETIVITPSCLKGIIDWNYPRGSLKVLFNEPKPYSLCLIDWLGGDAFTIYDNSFGKMTQLKMLSSENQCIQSNGNHAQLKVEAPPEQRYMGGFTYEIKY